jgi:excisionase family DNA binding protein
MTQRKTDIPALPPIDVNRRYSVNQALQYLSISRATFYKLCAAGRIRTIQDGVRRRFVGGGELARLSAESMLPSAQS